MVSLILIIEFIPSAVPMEMETDPESATWLERGSATFSCTASSTPPLNFMWYKDGESAALVVRGSVSISNQPNESSLALTNITCSDADAYYCVASNILCCWHIPMYRLADTSFYTVVYSICRPAGYPYWFGLLLPSDLSLVTAFLLMLTAPCVNLATLSPKTTPAPGWRSTLG